jgi:hypothetical protein
MYCIYGNIYHQYTPNVTIYAIHGSYGLGYPHDLGTPHDVYSHVLSRISPLPRIRWRVQSFGWPLGAMGPPWARVVTPKWSWYLQSWPCFQRHWSNAWGDFSLVFSFWSHDHRVDDLAMLLAYMSYFVCKERGNSSFFRFSLAKTVQSRPIFPWFIRLVEGNTLSGHPNQFDGIKPANFRWRFPLQSMNSRLFSIHFLMIIAS